MLTVYIAVNIGHCEVMMSVIGLHWRTLKVSFRKERNVGRRSRRSAVSTLSQTPAFLTSTRFFVDLLFHWFLVSDLFFMPVNIFVNVINLCSRMYTGKLWRCGHLLWHCLGYADWWVTVKVAADWNKVVVWQQMLMDIGPVVQDAGMKVYYCVIFVCEISK